MNGKVTLYVDQWGNRFMARTVKELHAKVGGARPAKMYADRIGKPPIHIGYVVGGHWCTAYQRVERDA